MQENKTTQCPDTNQLAEFLDHPGGNTVSAEVSAHLATCPDCRDLCQFAAKAKIKAASGACLTEKQKNELRKELRGRVPLEMPPAEIEKAWENVILKLTDFFSFQEDLEVVAASETMAELTFASLACTPRKYSWNMTLSIPSQITRDLKIRIHTTDASAATSGKLIFCGNELAVRNGNAEIPYDTLKNSFHNPDVMFCFQDGRRVPGFPML